MDGPALTVEDLRVELAGHVALTDVDLRVPRGSTLAVIGPNGSGKTTLLKAIAGLLHPARGRIATSGGHGTALVLQSTDVDPSVPITVTDTVSMARFADLGLLRRFGRADRAAVERAMSRLDVADLGNRQLHDLSEGQRQRVLVAQGLAQEADLLLLDEPVNGLDLPSQERILDVVDGERAAGRTAILTTHSLEEARRCDLVLLLATRAVAFGSPEEVVTEEHLRTAFGSHVLPIGDDFVMDDPHHVH